MRSSVLMPGLLGLAAAMPYDNAAEGEGTKLEKRDWCQLAAQWFGTCSRLPDAYGPVVKPDTVAAFKSYSGFSV